MIHKASGSLALLLALCLFAPGARAEHRSILVTDTSTSGKLVRVNVGASSGLMAGDPVLFSAGSKKIAAGRVFRADENSSIVVVLEKYGPESPILDTDYELLFGEPFPEAANLPDYVADREEEEDNPGNERFFDKNGEELTPELDDDGYTPEVTLRPKLPEPRTYSTHNITVGLAFFRNRTLPTPDTTNNDDPSQSSYTTYQGYTIRYAYTFRTSYWLKFREPALISAEASFGVYNFDHEFPASESYPNGTIANIRVIPLGMNLRYLVAVSKFLRLYPYIAFQYNLVTGKDAASSQLDNIRGGQLLGGAGAQLVVSNSIDARVQGGTDGILGALVVKF
jgi:hypothetical protein